DETVDGRDAFVIPGLVNVHSHPHTEPSFKGLREEHGAPEMFMTGLYERGQAYRLDEDGRKAGAEVAYSELLASGVTSFADLSSPFEGWIELVAKSGLRGFLAPGYASARWYLANDWTLGYEWNEQAGRQAMAHAVSVMQAAERHASGRLSALVFPAQIDTCTEELLRESADLARETGRVLTTHAAQSRTEFDEMVRRHGKTPIQFARDIGFLGENALLGHAIFIDEHSWTRWHTREDLKALSDSGTSVAHCPTPFSRYGQALEDFGRYLRAGVNMGIGTDTSPHNLIEEMRTAAILARIAARDVDAAHTADVFHAATIGGAKALQRSDIGRLAPGMKADLVVVDLADVTMVPARDPLRSLVYTAAERAVKDVYVDGIKVVADRKVLTLDRRDAAGRLAAAQARMMAAAPSIDFKGRSADEITPLSLPLR
ncbi:MAG: amidohydrolase family protein, partial [Alphaproteobacteria bacterium]